MKKYFYTFSLLASFVLLQIWMIHVIFNYSISGIIVAQYGDQWKIERFEPKSIPVEAGLKIGDTIISVNGKAPGEYVSVIKWRSLDQFNEIVVSHDGNRFTVIEKGNPFDINYDLLPILGGFLSFLMAIVIYKKIHQSKSAFILSCVFLNIGLVFTSLGASVRGDTVGKFIISAGVISLPVVFLHFLVVLMEEKGKIHVVTNYVRYLYIPVVLAFFVLMTTFLPMHVTYYIYSFSVRTTMIFFLVGIILNFYLLLYLYVKYGRQKSYLSTLIKMVWCSLIISFLPLVTFSFIPKLLMGHEWVDSFFLSWFVLFFPVSFAYLIITKQLYNIDTILRRILMTTIIALLPSGVFTGLIAIFYQNENRDKHLVLLFIAMVIIQSFFLYSLEYFMTKLQAILFPRKHLLQTSIQKIAKNLTSISSFSELKEIILVDIVKTLEVFGGAVVFKYKDTMETISEGDIDVAEVERFVESGETEHTEFSCLQINSHEEYSSYLIMTRTRTNTLLGMEEMQWLNIIISYLAVSLENLHLIRKLNVKLQHLAAQMPNEQEANDFVWFRKLTFELQEMERMRIATDLHDTTMQDLFFLKRRLVGVIQRYALSKEDQDHMSSLIEYIEIINTNLRQSCFELHPHLLKEIGLVQTLEKIIEREAYGSPFEIDFQTDQENRIEKRDMETKRHLFRMIQELLNNAKKHSEASKVVIRLRANKEGMTLSYEDDGIGFDPTRTAPRQIGSSGIGMEQLKSRVLHLNGLWELETGKGCGVKIRIALPSFESMSA